VLKKDISPSSFLPLVISLAPEFPIPRDVMPLAPEIPLSRTLLRRLWVRTLIVLLLTVSRNSVTLKVVSINGTTAAFRRTHSSTCPIEQTNTHATVTEIGPKITYLSFDLSGLQNLKHFSG